MTSRPARKPVLRAMCIDDSDFELMLNDRVLKRSEVFDEIWQFNDATEALGYLKTAQYQPDVIFLDINMPRLNGFEFLEAATEQLGLGFTSRVVIMLTSSLNPDDRARAEAYPMVKAFLSKPLTEEKAIDIAGNLP
jgi:CheY-like chemotaxis protein